MWCKPSYIEASLPEHNKKALREVPSVQKSIMIWIKRIILSKFKGNYRIFVINKEKASMYYVFKHFLGSDSCNH